MSAHFRVFDTQTIYYSKEVDFATATARANYKIDKGDRSFVSLPNTALVELMSGDRLVRITFSDATSYDIANNRDNWNRSNVRLLISDVQDKAGNTVSIRIYDVTIRAPISSIPTAIATAKDTIEIQVWGSTPLSTYNISDYSIVSAAGAPTDIVVSSIKLDNDDTTVILAISESLNTDATYGTDNKDIAVQINPSSELYGLADYNRNIVPVNDGIAPQWIYTYYNADPAEVYQHIANNTSIVLVFDEEVMPVAGN